MRFIFFIVSIFYINLCQASLIIPIFSLRTGTNIGVVKADDTIYGLLLTPCLHSLPPGTHGFHIHTCADCDTAGGHWDPTKTEEHSGPFQGNSHLGDLPVLIVNRDGQATLPVLAPRLKLEMIKNHSLIIDTHSDNYSDKPDQEGGGGAKIACGEIPYFN